MSASLQIKSPHPLDPVVSQKLREIAMSYCDSVGGCHGPDHALRVEKTALFIGEKMGARLDIIASAAILHDIGRREETKQKGGICHAQYGAKLAETILADFDFSVDDIEATCHVIESHRYRGSHPPGSLEAQILFDADKLDSIGAIGIGRAFLFAGEIGARLHNSNEDLIDSKSYSCEDTAYREFKVKMCKIKDRMLTPIGKELARKRHAFMEIFFNRLDLEFFGA